MVLINIFQDIVETIKNIDVLTLPILKQNALEIDYFEDDDNTTPISSELPLPFAASLVFEANISSWRRLTAKDGDCKAVYEVSLDVEDSNFNFKAGDTIGVIPQNDESDVDSIISHIDLTAKADVVYKLSVASSQKAKIPVHVPVRSTHRYVLTYCLDLRSVLKKLFLLALSKHTRDENERRIMEYFCSKEGSAAYMTHVLNNKLCILDIFSIFKSCKPPIEVLLGNLPRLLPRPYSIVNSGLKNNDQIKICFSVMTISNRKGLTTGWLEKIILNKENLDNQMQSLSISDSKDAQKIPIYLRKNMGQFCLPVNLETPIILIGPGTGIAPFIGFLEEKEFLKSPEAKLGDTYLFFGCRDPTLDFIYEDELNGFLGRRILNKLITAFSRVNDSPAKYIQDALKQNCKDVAKLIMDGATVFICGDLKSMVDPIKEALLKCLIDHGGSIEEAEKLIKEMQNNKRYLVDAWS